MACSYKIYEDLNFAIHKYSGSIALDELYEIVKTYFEDPNFSKIQSLLVDGSECSAKFVPDEVLRFAKFMDLFKEKDHHKKVVFIVVSPKEVACAEIFKWLNGKSKREYCLTTEKAFNLLGLPISFDDFLGKLEDLK